MFKMEFQIFKKVSFELCSVVVERLILKITLNVTLKVKEVFTSGTQNIWYIAPDMCFAVRKYPSEHFLNKSVRVLCQTSGLRV